MPPGPPSACSVCVRADRPQNTINVPCQWQPSLGTQQSSGVLLRWRGCGPTVLQVDTQPRTAHTYTLQFQLDEKRDDFPCPLRAANVPAQQFLLADKRALPLPGLSQPQLCLHWSFCLASIAGTGTFPCLATLQPSPCSFWWHTH